MSKKTFLAVYDYGTGGIWILIDAVSKEQIEKRYPKLIAFEDKPDWMTEEEKKEYFESCKKIGFHWDIEKAPTGWLARLNEEAN
ncbi:MAG TPA: hypothetical protein VFX02_10785 [Gammaproteobacteria bacterium]|nr:hypothetical protein [Gammaproteobacteria bacterium]